MQHEVVRFQPLLDARGVVAEEGWARRPMWRYDREAVHASRLRIKEWDYYALSSAKGRWAIGLTLSDLGFGALMAIAFVDYQRRQAVQADGIRLLTLLRTGFSPSSGEDNRVALSDGKIRLEFEKKGERRRLAFAAPALALPDGRVGLEGDVVLVQEPSLESINIATTWKENRRAFYLNEKVNCMPASGTLRLGGREERLEEGDVWGVLDWGRGRWTYKNRWFWGSASGVAGGRRFGFNLGYGFSDRSSASENALFCDGRLHKLQDVRFGIPQEGYLAPWTIEDSEGRLRLRFDPAVDRFSDTNLLLIRSVQHQVFGLFSGEAVLDGGERIIIKDLPGFAEEVFNRW